MALVPQLLPAPATRGVCIIIDILRATTTLTTLLEYGAARVLVAPQATEARALKAADPAAFLLGEIGGLRPSDFDYGNSPHELAPAPLTVLGCLRNATAVVAHASTTARPRGPAHGRL